MCLTIGNHSCRIMWGFEKGRTDIVEGVEIRDAADSGRAFPRARWPSTRSVVVC
jgi:hypothetical protein